MFRKAEWCETESPDAPHQLEPSLKLLWSNLRKGFGPSISLQATEGRWVGSGSCAVSFTVDVDVTYAQSLSRLQIVTTVRNAKCGHM